MPIKLNQICSLKKVLHLYTSEQHDDHMCLKVINNIIIVKNRHDNCAMKTNKTRLQKSTDLLTLTLP